MYVPKVVEAINESQEAIRPDVFVSATAVGYYGIYLAPVFCTHCILLVYKLLVNIGYPPICLFNGFSKM